MITFVVIAILVIAFVLLQVHMLRLLKLTGHAPEWMWEPGGEEAVCDVCGVSMMPNNREWHEEEDL